MGRLSARELLATLVDPDSWVGWDVAPSYVAPDASYDADLARAAARTGVDESVVTGRARIGGHDVALVVSEFGFLGGSVGRASARRIAAAVRRATDEGLPLLAAPASGGTRMQEGTPAFVTMVDLTRAVVRHKRAGLPYLVYLRDPVTGGVLASWGSLGHLTLAEPGALVGFLGPTVYEALTGEAFPTGVQRAEHLVARGVVDAVVAPERLRVVVGRALALLGPREPAAVEPLPAPAAGAPSDVWSSIEASRRADRPGVRELLRYAAEDVLVLSGTGAGETGPALLGALASIGGRTCVVVGQDRAAQAVAGPLGPGDLRVARRLVRLAEELRLPLVCVIDTPGADLSVAAEEGALAGEIARCLADLVEATVPSVAVLLGQGCGGGALALLPCRRVVAAEHAWLAPLPPEGASAILFGSTARAPEMARRQRVAAIDLLAEEIVHELVPEEPAAHLAAERFCRRVASAVIGQLVTQERRTVTATTS